MKLQIKAGEFRGDVMIDQTPMTVRVRRKGRDVEFSVRKTPVGCLLIHEGEVFDLTWGNSIGTGSEIFVNQDILMLEWNDPRSAPVGRKHGAAGNPLNVRSIMPGRIAKILVQPGDRVHEGDPLVVLEAMKMENELKAKTDGMVEKVMVAQGMSVESNALLMTLKGLETFRE